MQHDAPALIHSIHVTGMVRFGKYSSTGPTFLPPEGLSLMLEGDGVTGAYLDDCGSLVSTYVPFGGGRIAGVVLAVGANAPEPTPKPGPAPDDQPTPKKPTKKRTTKKRAKKA